MRFYPSIMISVLVAGSSALSSGKASAQDIVVQLPTAQGSAAGIANLAQIAGDVWLNWSDGISCSWWKLGTGKLHNHVAIYGSELSEIIKVADSTFNVYLCGTRFTLSPPDQNFFQIWVDGRGGDDVLNMQLGEGGAGNDWITAINGLNANIDGAWIFGGNGNDTFFADYVYDALNGDAGQDRFCAPPSATIGVMSGGADQDYRCGSASSMSSVTLNCSKCP